jgi:hypothetical protein
MLTDLMPQLPADRPNHLLGIGDEPGRGLHPSTLQLIVTVCGLHASTFRLDASCFHGICWKVPFARTSQVELRSGCLMWLQSPKTAQVELRSG